MIQIGEGFVGSGPNAAHINTVLGQRSGPVGTAWAGALAGPSAGHAPFVAVARPALAVVPPTLFVNKAAIASPEHGIMTWGPAQAGVAKGVSRALQAGSIDLAAISELVLICAVWVNPEADDAQEVYVNNTEATANALANGAQNLPTVEDFLSAADDIWNPFFRPEPG